MRILELVADADGSVIQRQAKVAGTRMRYDARMEYSGKVYMVEFDGDSHFRDANVIYRDNLKDAAMAQAGISVVRIPYFVQLDNDTFYALFGFDCPFSIRTDFPHGFITTKMLPASFCGLGVSRFKNVLKQLPEQVVQQIDKSLDEKVKGGLPVEFVR